jgi:hypothetical protein
VLEGIAKMTDTMSPQIDNGKRTTTSRSSPIGRSDSFGDNYNPYRIPPNLTRCEKHSLANRVYRHIKVPSQDIEKCDCCGHPVQNERLPLMTPVSELSHLGSSFPLFFETIKVSGLILLIIWCTMGIYGVISNASTGDCQPDRYKHFSNSNDANSPNGTTVNVNNCNPSVPNLMSLGNKRYSHLEKLIQVWLVFGSIIIIFMLYQLFRRHVRRTISNLNATLNTPSDYTVKINYFPKTATLEDIKQFLNEQVDSLVEEQNKPIEIKRVLMAYDTNQHLKLSRRIAKLTYEHLNANRDKKKEIVKQLHDRKKELQAIEKNNSSDVFTGVVYVTFNSLSQCKRFLKAYQVHKWRTFLAFIGLGRCARVLQYEVENAASWSMIIKRAAEPTDIIWKNLGYHWGDRLIRRISVGFATALLLSACFGILAGITYEQIAIREQEDVDNVERGLSFSASFAILIINKALQVVIRKIATLEKNTTHTDHHLSVCQKLCAALFLNTAITVLLAHLFLQWLNGYNVKKNPSQLTSDNVWGQGGLIEDLWSIFWSNAFVSPILNIIDPIYLWKLFKQKSMKEDGENCKLTQLDAHTVFEGPEFDVAEKYAGVVKTVWLTAFYAPAIPICIPISLGGLFFQYWAEKYVLLRRSSYPLTMGSHLPKSTIVSLECTTFIYALGSLIFSVYASYFTADEDYYIAPNVAAVVISFAYLVFPINYLNKFMCSMVKKEEEDTPYDEARLDFPIDYDISNPITHNRALRDMLLYMERKNPDKLKTYIKAMATPNQDTGTPDLNLIYMSRKYSRNVDEINNMEDILRDMPDLLSGDGEPINIEITNPHNLDVSTVTFDRTNRLLKQATDGEINSRAATPVHHELIKLKRVQSEQFPFLKCETGEICPENFNETLEKGKSWKNPNEGLGIEATKKIHEIHHITIQLKEKDVPE